MATQGKFVEYNPGKEDWKSYIEQMQMFFTANHVKDFWKTESDRDCHLEIQDDIPDKPDSNPNEP